MPKRTWILLVTAGLFLTATLVSLWGRADAADVISVGDQPATPSDPLAHLTRLQIDVFELSCTSAQLAEFNLDQVGQGNPGAPEVVKRLGQLGTARVLLRYDNIVDLAANTSVGTGMQVPAVKDIVLGSDGNFAPSVAYESIGFTGVINGLWVDTVDPFQAQINMRFECSDLSDKNLRVADKADIPMFTQRLLIEQTRMLKSGEPTWLSCNDLHLSAPPNAETKLTVIRLVATRLTD